MREAVVQQLGGTSRQAEIPVPSGGLNTRESRSSMPITDAVQFQNLISEPDGVASRLGYTSFGTGMTGTVNHLSEYVNASTKQLVVGAGTVLYSFGTGGGTATSVKTGFTNTDFESAQLSGSMVLVNGADTPQIYNGSTSTDAVYSGDLNTDGPSNVDGINVHKSRMYVWDTDTSNFYYGATNAVQGAFAKFPLNEVSKTGGNLLIMKSISRDGGSGPDDYACFILDTGEVIVYQGNDPGTAANWALVGRYFIPAPINKRSAIEFAGDIVVLTRQDIVALSDTINASTETGSVLLKPSKLGGAIREAFNTYGNNSDWQLSVYNNKGWLVVNVPEVDGSNFFQYVQVFQTQAPSKFIGWNATVFGSFNNGLYFGGDGVVFKGDSGFDDNGSNIDCLGQQAYSTLGIAQIKNVRNLTITYLFDGSSTLGAEIGYDYIDKEVQNTATSEPIGPDWDTSEWDTAEWAGASAARNVKFSVAGTGRSLSTTIQFSIQGAQFRWLGTNINLEVQRMI
jgi:hypothetical protein